MTAFLVRNHNDDRKQSSRFSLQNRWLLELGCITQKSGVSVWLWSFNWWSAANWLDHNSRVQSHSPSGASIGAPLKSDGDGAITSLPVWFNGRLVLVVSRGKQWTQLKGPRLILRCYNVSPVATHLSGKTRWSRERWLSCPWWHHGHVVGIPLSPMSKWKAWRGFAGFSLFPVLRILLRL